MLYMMIRNFQTASHVILSFLQFDSALGCFPGRLGELSTNIYVMNTIVTTMLIL